MLIKKRILTLAILTFIQFPNLYAQIPTLNPFFFGDSSKESKVTPSNLTSIGKYYSDTNWNAGNLFLNNGDSLVAYYMRYDLVRNHVEIIIDTKIKAINGSFIDSLEWFSIGRLRPEKYLNKKITSLRNEADISGFTEILCDGKIKLYKCKMVFAPRQATSPTLVNDTDSEVQVLEKYYYEKSGELFEIANSKKRNLNFLDTKGLDGFIKQENLKFSNERDLIEIAEFVNSK
ncbi:hypothetical protein [Ekhidna sp.]